MKRYHKRFLALCLSASMLVSPLSYTRAYASSDEAGVTENSSQNETVAESENKSESQSPAAEVRKRKMRQTIIAIQQTQKNPAV